MKQVGWLILQNDVRIVDHPFNPLSVRLTEVDKRAGYSETAVFIEEPEDRFTDPQGNVWTRPTAWAYYAACRSANFWRDQREAIRTILDQRVPEDAPATPLSKRFRRRSVSN